jgi:hypothetical protein
MGDGPGVALALEDSWLNWQVPGKPVSVRFGRDVAGRLRMAVWEGFRSLRRRGLETGGLLFGTTREAGNQIVVEVDDFEPFDSEHASGPSYVLSDADLRLLEARIAAHEDPESPAIVGFYRSHTRGDFALTSEDALLFSKCFPAESHVFLLIKSDDDGLPTGGFIIREGGKVLSKSPYAQFPLPLPNMTAAVRDTRLVTVAVPDTPLTTAATRDTPLVTAPTSRVPPKSVPAVPSLKPLGSAWMVRRPVWLAACAVLVVGVAASMAIRGRSPASMPARPALPLALNVTRAENSLRLSWNRPPSHPGASAVLWIKDGHAEQRFELDARQFAEGTIVYWPRSSDVNFRLELLPPGAAVAESVRAIGGPSNPPVVVAEPAVATTRPAPPALQPNVALRPPAAALRRTDPGAQFAGRPAKQLRQNRTGSASRQLSRAFALTPPQTDSPPAGPASLPDPPIDLTAGSVALQHNEEIFKGIVSANNPGGAADPRVRVSPEPPSGSLLGQLGRNLPLIGKRYRRAAGYVPPAPLRSPPFPDPPRRNLAKHVGIDVKVHVNPSGKVDYAEVLSKLSPADRDLAALAIFSARKWEFIPARSGNDTVPGTVILHYQFGPRDPGRGEQAFVAH